MLGPDAALHAVPACPTRPHSQARIAGWPDALLCATTSQVNRSCCRPTPIARQERLAALLLSPAAAPDDLYRLAPANVSLSACRPVAPFPPPSPPALPSPARPSPVPRTSMASTDVMAAQLAARAKTLVNNDLKKICKEEGQVQSGNKAQLQARVIASTVTHLSYHIRPSLSVPFTRHRMPDPD